MNAVSEPAVKSVIVRKGASAAMKSVPVKPSPEPLLKPEPSMKTVTIMFTNSSGEVETQTLSGSKVGHRIEPLTFPVVTIWANNPNGGDKTLVFINPLHARVEIAS